MKNTVLEYMVPARDGTKLYTVVQIPEGAAPGARLPVILKRSPYIPADYDKSGLFAEDTRGYVAVTQHCRGCGLSEGDCIPFVNERLDGLDALEWIRAQPFYNGEIFLFGVSYLSSVHHAYLDTDPADVKGAVLCVQDPERYNALFLNGVFRIGLAGCWSLGMYKKNSIPAKPFVEDTFRTLPLSGFTRHVFGEPAPEIEEPMRHPERDDPYWDTPAGGSEYRGAFARSTMPILIVSSFYDIYTQGVFDLWNGLSAARRANCAMVVTPFDHGYDWRPQPESLPPGCDFPGGRISELAPGYEYEWFDAVRGNRGAPFAPFGTVTYYTLFENRWHSAPALPEGGAPLRLFLNAGGALGRDAGKPEPLTYLYNPFAPASFPGGVCNNFGGLKVQDPPSSRYDILSFVSEPLGEDMVFSGGVECGLTVASDAPDTCFYVRVDIVRDGVALPLRDGICALGHFHPDYVPGDKVRIGFRMAPHSFAARAGDRLRVDVSSSCMPHFVPHTNRRGLYCDQTGADPARNTIFTAESSVVLHRIAESIE